MVAETGSFSLAAKKLFITQPAISKRIALLEQSLDTKLFDRIGRQVHLTQAGIAVRPGYQRILAEIDESHRIISNLRHTTSGTLKFGTSHHIGLHRLPPILRDYTQKYHDVDLAIQFIDSEQASTLLLNGSIELALITLPEQIEKNLKIIPVWPDPMVCVVASDHVLAKEKTITRKQLRQHGILLQSHNTHTRDIIERALSIDSGFKVIMESNYLETIKAMIQNGLGWGILPVSMVDDSLHPLQIKGVTMQRQLGALLHATRTLSSPATSLLEILKHSVSRRCRSQN